MKKSLRISLVSILTASSVSFRFIKNSLTAFQFVNFPLAFAMIAGFIMSYQEGFLVGFLSFVISDLMILPGIWTIIDSLVAGFIGFIWGFLRNILRNSLEAFIVSYISTLFYDIVSSTAFYMVFGLDFMSALISGIIGLFLPIFGGNILGIGPITEGITSFLVVSLIFYAKKILKGIKNE